MVTAPVTSEVLAVYEAAVLHINRIGLWRLEGFDSPDSILLPLFLGSRCFRMPICTIVRPPLGLLDLRLRPQSLYDDWA